MERGRGTQKEAESTLVHSDRLKDQRPSETQEMKSKRKTARLAEEILLKHAGGFDNEVEALQHKLGKILRALGIENTQDLRDLQARLLEDATKDERVRQRRRIRQWRHGRRGLAAGWIQSVSQAWQGEGCEAQRHHLGGRHHHQHDRPYGRGAM